MLPWSAAELGRYPWYALPEIGGNLIAVIFVTASSTLFNTAGIEVALHREANLERELNVTGLANMLSGVFGGYTGCISISRTVLNFNGGGTGRLSGLTVAAISALMLAVAPVLLGYMPKFVLGGLLIYLAADTLHRWIIESRKRLSLPEYLSLLAIIAVIVQWGFIAGIGFGVVIGCATFALSAARIDSIKYHFNGTEFRSTLDRSRDDQAVLSAHGGKIQGLNLQSYLFFGSANRLYQHVKELLPDIRNAASWCSISSWSPASIPRRPIVSPRSSAPRRTVASGWCWCNLAASAEKALRSSEFITDDVSIMPRTRSCAGMVRERGDRAASGPRAGRGQPARLVHPDLGNEADATALMHRCERIEVDAGDTIVRAGDAADSMHFILDGRVGIMVGTGEDRTTRVRSLGRYTTIGEMGLVSRALRSATIQAEIASVLYVLSADQFEAIKTDDPALSQKLLTYFVSVMAERLTFANRTIAVLRR